MRPDSREAIAAQYGDVYVPRLVVTFQFETSSPYITSHGDETNVPGTNILGALKSVSAITQQVYPDDGRATIGGCRIDIVDIDSPPALTEELASQLLDVTTPEGIRDKECQVYWGWGTDFSTDYTRVATMYVDNVEYNAGVYRITCRDKSKFLRTDLWEPKVVQLDASITATSTEIPCNRAPDTVGFQTYALNAAYDEFNESPSVTEAGWIRIKGTGEIILYTSIVADEFRGCRRGQFNTVAQAVELDANDSEEIEEVVYLQGPAVWVAKAVMTGVLDDTVSPNATLPDHWHGGVDPADLVGFDTIGDDLYVPGDLTKGFPVRFLPLDAGDLKTFLEEQIYRLIGCYAMTTAYGRLKLKRLNKIIQNVAPFTAADQQIIGHSSLKHMLRSVLNNFAIDYEYNGEDLTRRIILIDSESVNRHQKAKQKLLEFYGLYTAKHTQAAIYNMMAVYRDRYAEPPLGLQVKLPFRYSRVEIGDLIRITCSTLRDYSNGDNNAADPLDRVFEVQKANVNWTTGVVTLDLFASVREIPSPTFNLSDSAIINDAWYENGNTGSAEGTDISGLGGYSGGTLTGYTFVGHPTDINDSTAVFYCLNDLTITDCLLRNNVQLRVRGTLTIDKSGGVAGLNGRGNGTTSGASHQGGVDGDLINGGSSGWSGADGTDGYLPTTAGAGVWLPAEPQTVEVPGKTAGVQTDGDYHDGAPHVILDLDADGYVISRLPADISGSGGPSGAQVVTGSAPNWDGSAAIVRANGGDGGDGGAGLAIFCRTLAFSPDGDIDLSGQEGQVGETSASAYDLMRSVDNIRLHAGSGASGAPGCLLVFLDGDLVPYPTIDSVTFKAVQYGHNWTANTQPPQGTTRVGNNNHPVMFWNDGQFSGGAPYYARSPSLEGQQEDENKWRACFSAHYVPDTRDKQEDKTPAPQTLVLEPAAESVDCTFNRSNNQILQTEIWTSITNNRAAAELAGVSSTGFQNVRVPAGQPRYFWIRNLGWDNTVSDWYPTSATGGQLAQSYSYNLHLADPFMNTPEAWEGDGITGLSHQTGIDVGWGATATAWRFEEGNSNIDLYARSRTGPSEFDVTHSYGSSPITDDAMYCDITVVWRRTGGTSWGSMYLLSEWYASNGVSTDNDVPGYDPKIVDATDINAATANTWYTSTRKFLMGATIGSLLQPTLYTDSPAPTDPHYIRHFLRVGTSGSGGGNYIDVSSVHIIPSNQ